jgi:predicted GNAT family acetyltransferase
MKREGQVKNTTKVTRSRFEIEQDGEISYLEFETDGHGWMTIWHTEVAKGQRGKGIGLELVTTAFQYAKENSLQVDVICPLAHHLVETHPEFKALLGKR